MRYSHGFLTNRVIFEVSSELRNNSISDQFSFFAAIDKAPAFAGFDWCFKASRSNNLINNMQHDRRLPVDC